MSNIESLFLEDFPEDDAVEIDDTAFHGPLFQGYQPTWPDALPDS